MEQLFDVAKKERSQSKYESVSCEHSNHPPLPRHVSERLQSPQVPREHYGDLQ